MGIPAKTARWFAAAVVAAVLVFCAAKADEDTRVFRIGCPSRCTETVTSRKGRLYIPGNWDITRITIEMEGGASFRLSSDGEVVPPGEEIDLTKYVGESMAIYGVSRSRLTELAVFRGSEIPSLFLTVDGKQFSQIRQSKNNVITEGHAVYEEADGSVSYDGGITQMRGRGNNTFAYTKKPYQIKLEKKASLSGMARAKTWVLLANWNDVSLLRNQVMLDMCREAGLRFALSCVQADIWINGEYNGLYLLSEKPQIKKERIDLRDLEDETEALNSVPLDDSLTMSRGSTHELPLMRWYQVENNPEDITGGYLFTIEKYARLRDYKIPGFRTENGLSIQIKEPTYPGREQTEYLGGLVNEMHEAVIAEDGINGKTGKHYTEYIDIDSFALKFLAEDWCKNYDYIGGSQYMYKDADDRDPLIYAGPAWDYDLSFGNMADRGYGADGNYVTTLSGKAHNIYWLLARHGDFMDRARAIWAEKFRPAAAILLGERKAGENSVVRPLDEYAANIRDSARMNYARWGFGNTTDRDAGRSFSNACAYLKKWITRRTAYMDGQLSAAEKHE